MFHWLLKCSVLLQMVVVISCVILMITDVVMIAMLHAKATRS